MKHLYILISEMLKSVGYYFNYFKLGEKIMAKQKLQVVKSVKVVGKKWYKTKTFIAAAATTVVAAAAAAAYIMMGGGDSDGGVE